MNAPDIKAQTYHIEKVWGTDNRLYNLIGPFVMNPTVIRLNGGYPFKNTEDHIWYIAMKNKNMVIGFLSVHNKSICNDFTWQDNNVLRILIDKALSDMNTGTMVSFTAVERELELLESLGFSLEQKYTQYFKMVKTV